MTDIKLFYKELNLALRSHTKLVAPVFNDLPPGGRFHCNLSRAYRPETYLNRSGVWSDPWETIVEPSVKIPRYDPSFSLTFEEVTNRRALDIKKILNETDKNVSLFYSGGIDSTTCLVALISNLDSNELSRIYISMSADSILENPVFYDKFIRGKFKIFDSMLTMYTDLIDQNFVCISADAGDFIYGTELGVKMYPQIPLYEMWMEGSDKKIRSDLYYSISSAKVHYSEYKDILINYFNSGLANGVKLIKSSGFLPQGIASWRDEDDNFGRLFYEKIDKNIKSTDIPVISLHDFFWWTMFNMRFTWGCLRPAIAYGLGDNMKHIIQEGIFSWYSGEEYQLWSMVNNNNGEKINGTTISSYKQSSRNYIYKFDKNDWYRQNKIKMPSTPIIHRRNWKKNFKSWDTRFGMDQDYNMLRIGDPSVDKYIIDGLYNYKIDWS